MRYILVLLSGFQVADGIITHVLVKNGLVQEGNPLLVSIVSEGDFLMLKVLGALLCVLFLWGIYQRFRNVALVTTSSIVMFYGAVMSWNLSVFFSA